MATPSCPFPRRRSHPPRSPPLLHSPSALTPRPSLAVAASCHDPLVPPPLHSATPAPSATAASRSPGLAAPPTSHSPPNRLRRHDLGPAHTGAARASRCRLRSPWPWPPLRAWCWRSSPTPSLCKSAQRETLGRVPLANGARSLKRKRDKNKRERKRFGKKIAINK